MKYSCYSSLKALHWSRRACFLSLSLVPQYFTLKIWHNLKKREKKKKKWVRKTRNIWLFLFCSGAPLLADMGRETPQKMFDQALPWTSGENSWMIPVAPHLSSARLIFYIFSDWNLFLISLEMAGCKKVSIPYVYDAQPFQSEILMKILTLLANCS